ncbi:hypothetical protein IIE18_11420 [Pseudomonas sp. V1]|uniref:hypothetical protein n=1 Tax=Pseudomonas arcuscaelestis TaxID=2710591 RepID=UPI00193FD03C|nr:hypothetical protein [Pseudomonas arcuscaelestis]MBM3105751.1 hypothetical protein [Pseudomonas arcuscaelestis]
MLVEAKTHVPWDLATPRAKRSKFRADSFYVVIDGLHIHAVRQAATMIKEALLSIEGVRVRGPLALKTERRRFLLLRDVMHQGQKGLRVPAAKRLRNVLLVMNPTSIAVASLISLPVPSGVNLRIEPYQAQYELKDPSQCQLAQPGDQ